jgi:UDP-N-acetylglucosamine 1-carboxyvinyltransferase
MKDAFSIVGLAGKKTLEGTISVKGAKNAVLPAMASVFLFADALKLTNVPDIEDVHRMCELLAGVGVDVEKHPHTCTVSSVHARQTELDRVTSKMLRASVILTGPMLARLGEVIFPHPGGCVIGPRPIDIFLEGFEKMGATVNVRDDAYHIVAPGKKLRGADIFFRIVSVTATETLMMAAVLASGTTKLSNAAMEPEITHLANFLISCGARIEGAGTPTITIRGGRPLMTRGAAYKTVPDRIETGSFLLLGALAANNLEVTDCEPEHVEILTDMLIRAGVPIEIGRHTISIVGNGVHKNKEFTGCNLRTHEYPGFATDLQAPMVVFLTQASGESVVFETIFEGRLNYVHDLVRMGASITTWNPHQVMIKGPTSLRSKHLEAPDLRTGLAFVIAATVAKGNSIIDNVHYIDRGYERMEDRLGKIGLSIERIAV